VSPEERAARRQRWKSIKTEIQMHRSNSPKQPEEEAAAVAESLLLGAGNPLGIYPGGGGEESKADTRAEFEFKEEFKESAPSSLNIEQLADAFKTGRSKEIRGQSPGRKRILRGIGASAARLSLQCSREEPWLDPARSFAREIPRESQSEQAVWEAQHAARPSKEEYSAEASVVDHQESPDLVEDVPVATRAKVGPETCANCNQNPGASGLKVCSGCRLVSYCCGKCQKAHWKYHKAGCQVQARAPPAAVPASPMKPASAKRKPATKKKAKK